MNLAYHEDQLLIERIRNNEKRSFDALYDLYWKALFQYAFKRTQTEDVAKDLVQDVFISFWNKRHTLVLTSSLSAYLFSILKFKLIDLYYADEVRKKHALTVEHDEPVLSEHTDHGLHVNEINSLLNGSVEDLPSRMREVFELSRIKGYSIRQISTHLKISEQTVKNQLSSALKKLRLNFTDYLTAVIIFLTLR